MGQKITSILAINKKLSAKFYTLKQRKLHLFRNKNQTWTYKKDMMKVNLYHLFIPRIMVGNYLEQSF